MAGAERWVQGRDPPSAALQESAGAGEVMVLGRNTWFCPGKCLVDALGEINRNEDVLTHAIRPSVSRA